MSDATAFAVLGAVAAAAALVEVLEAAVRARGEGRALRAERARRAAHGRRARILATLARVGRRAGLPLPAPGDLQARIHAAGLSDRLGPADVMAVKGGGALVAGLAAAAPALAAPGRLGPLLPVAAACAAFLAPDAWLRRRARRRAATLTLEVADVLDLLRVAVGAGMPAPHALGEVGRRHAGLLGLEFATTAGRIALGVPRADAYARLAARCPPAPVAALAVALERADRHGAPLEPVLRSLALDARAERARAVQERAARAAPKIQLVVALVLVPAVLLLVAAVLIDNLA